MKALYQIAVDTHDGTIIYSMPETYRLALPNLRTWIENTLYFGQLPQQLVPRTKENYKFVLVKGVLQFRKIPASADQKLMSAKYWAIDQICMLINNHRFRILNKLFLQDRLYALKLEEAEKILARQNEVLTASHFQVSCPLLYEESLDKDLSLIDVARSVLLAKDEQDSVLKRTEIMRMRITQRISKAATRDEVMIALDMTRSEFYNRL